ncbi:MAG: ArnT family glycosyltransferase [Bryobacteraceae bacterium]
MATQYQLPESPSVALAPPPADPTRKRQYYILVFLFLLETLLVIHLRVLALPFFWDEHGQFIPTALDLLRSGSWIAHSTAPNVHPPGVEAYLVLWYKLLGFSIPVTRVAMLVLAAFGLLVTFLLTLELTERRSTATPAFLACVFLGASPLFFTQSMMAELDMPAMLFTLLALLLFLRKNYAASAVTSIGLVLAKETGLVVPVVLCLFLLSRKDWRRAAYFLAPGVVLLAWLLFLHRSTGYWLGNPSFAHYNVTYALHPARVAMSFVRHMYYLFFAEFRWIGTMVLLITIWRAKEFRKDAWRVVIAVAAVNIVVVTVLGGAELERYLLPVLPFFYIAVAIALTCLQRSIRVVATTGLAVGLLINLFWNPPYPFPYENNYAMVDFVRLQQLAADFVQRNLANRTIATAWPYSAALKSPDYGFVDHGLKVIETNDFHFSSIRALPAKSYDVLITYTRTWAPKSGVIGIPIVREFLSRFYQFQPEISEDQCRNLGLKKIVSWKRNGQEITIYMPRGIAGTSRMAVL